MLDYTRRIAYLYAYELGEKTRCAGFVKVTARDGRGQLLIHLKLSPFSEIASGKAYIYFYEQNRNIGIYLGELTRQSDALTWQGYVDADNILEKEISLNHTSGIFIRCPGNRIYAAQWDDRPANIGQFTLYPKGGVRCIRCPWFDRCERSREDAPDRRGTIYERSHPAGP